MTSQYTDKDGKQYTYHDEFKDESKDLFIISSDNMAFRVDSDLLKTNSSVFRSMFSTCDTDDRSLHLDHSNQAIAISFKTLCHLPLGLDRTEWEQFIEGVELCIQYEMPRVGSKILSRFNLYSDIFANYGYSLFLLSAKLNDVATACRIIPKIGPMSYASNRNENRFWCRSGWARSVALDLPPIWYWAYTSAHSKATANAADGVYWQVVAITFMVLVLDDE
uniref:BTB domain-containing protein n=1 Tax=Kwoniella dejecticola CBS 10117 TaxID=1296121 RepID=A0A1A6A963_9TREE|nr:uncharacterized protein I303_02604 [Kwoniella dejecticola CBS 10117]OBR86595.1 hypothetical protein I303_02604 [Kwoniella dejecticola CBS 10117]